MRIAYLNLFDSATAVTASSEDILYPVENLDSPRLAKEYRTEDASAQTIVVDLGAAQDVDTIAIISHNISASADTVIEANASDAWGSPSFTTSLTWQSGMILKYLSSAESYRYWRFSVDDGTNADGYVSIGKLWLGERIQITPTSLLNFSVRKVRDDVVVYGRGRQKYANAGEGWRRFDLRFPRTRTTTLSAIQTMYDTVGNHTSVIFSNFDTIRDYEIVEPCYCSIVGDLDFSHRRGMQFEYTLRFEEDL